MAAVWWVLWALVGVVLVLRVRRALREPLERDRIIAAARDSYEGPDSLRLDEQKNQKGD